MAADPHAPDPYAPDQRAPDRHAPDRHAPVRPGPDCYDQDRHDRDWHDRDWHHRDWHDRVYQRLLRLFPRPFRERFGADMTELFRDRRRLARLRHGRRGLALVWLRAIADVLSQAASERVGPPRSLSMRGRAPRVRPSLLAVPPGFTHPKEGTMRTFLYDLPHALRSLVRQPGFLTIAVLTLGLGIGANTAIFTVVHAVLLAPLPYPAPDRLVVLGESDRDGGFGGASLPNVEEWRRRSASLEDVAVWIGQSVNLTGREEPVQVRGGFSSSSFLRMLGVTPHLGRLLTPDDDKPGAARVVVLSYAAWQRRFAGDPDILGRTLRLNNDPYAVVGIAPRGFWFPFDENELWLPAQYHPSAPPQSRTSRLYVGVGRLKPGVSLEQARAELDALGRTLAGEYPNENANRGIAISTMTYALARNARASLLMLLGAVAFVLLIACVNLANLLLARGAGRQRELAVRAALGATRGRLFAQLLTESLLLAGIGGIAGLGIAYLCVPLLVANAPSLNVRPDVLTNGAAAISAPVIAFALGLSVLTGAIFGTMPSVRLSRADLQARLRDGTRGTDGRGSQRIRSLLVVTEVALSLMLLVGAGLLTRSLIRLAEQTPGFDADHVLSLEYRLPRSKYESPTAQWRFHEQVVERVRQVPGVTSAALVRALAFSGNGGTISFRLPDQTGGQMDGTAAADARAQSNLVTPDYFATMGIPVLQGRTCRAEDHAGAPTAVIVNQHLAQRAWPNGDALGARILLDRKVTGTIVGVVGDTKHDRLQTAPGPQIYTCYSQQPFIFATLVAKTAVEPMSLERAVKTAIWSIDRDQPVWKVRTVSSLLEGHLAPRRFEMWLMIGTALVALLLAVVGIYGVMSYMVQQRTREIGVRMALGAARGDIARMVVGRALALTVAGLVLGALGARAVAQLLGSMLFGVTASDGVTYAAVAALLTMVALLASYLPTRRAMRVDPVRALRAD